MNFSSKAAMVLHRLINFAPVKRALTESRTLTRMFFEWRYRSTDPYGARSPDEQEKISHAFSVLGERKFGRGLDVGCGEGWNTRRVAELCEDVVAVDISSRAIERARDLNSITHVDYEVLDVVDDALPDAFDYVFCAETLYYLRLRQLDRVRTSMIEAVAPGGVLHLLHSRALEDDSSGLKQKAFGARTIHDAFCQHDELLVLADEWRPMYRVTVLRKRNGA